MRLLRTLPQQHMIYMAFMRKAGVYYRLGLYDFRFWHL
jgi:hypothetical protein